MSALVLARRMQRLDDGMLGVVAYSHGELRILYNEHGEQRVAAKSEKWIHAELPPMPLRAEEKFMIAAFADRALRAYERHEPFKFWETPRLSDEPYDGGLIIAILAYLTERDAAPEQSG